MSKGAIVKGVVMFVAMLGGSVSGQVIPNQPAFTSDGRIPLGLADTSLRYRAMIVHSEPTAFIFDWNDGTTSREPSTGFLSPFNGAVLGDYVFHTWSAEGIYAVTITAVDNLGATSTSAPLAVTIYPAIVCGDGICDPGPIPALPGETCTDCVADCGVCTPICTDGVCDPGESCVTCSPDCGLCVHAGNSTVDGFTSRIGMLRVGGSQTWQVANPPGIALESSTATMYRNPQNSSVGSGTKSVEDLWIWLRTPETMAQAGFETLPVQINASNQFTLSNPGGSIWSFGTWTFFLAWDVGNGDMVVTPLTQMIVPSQTVQDPWSLFGGAFDQPGHAEWFVVSDCPLFTSVTAQMSWYIPFDFCPTGQDCGPGMGFIFPIYQYSDGWTFVNAPSFVSSLGFQTLASTHVFPELGNYAVTARLWDQSMSNPSNTVSSVLHVHQFEPVCPNGLCDGFETFSSCPEDCAAGCGDAICGAGEDCNNCKADCGACPQICGDGICECPVGNVPGEDCNNCAADCDPCPPPCGDGACDPFAEDCNTCPADCGACPSEICNECATQGDGVFCNGAEACVNGICQAGTPVDCNDGVACTDDSCNEATDSCDNIANNANCDNGLFCDGSETCHPLFDCQPGSDPCSGQGCDEGTDTCSGSGCVTDGDCDNGLFCDGVETCDAVLGCQAGSPPTCNDGIACTSDTCDPVTDQCANDLIIPCCGNGTCDAGEDCDACANDCIHGNAIPPGCGNGICEPFERENCKRCQEDCAGQEHGAFCCGNLEDGDFPVSCDDPRCSEGGFACSDVAVAESCCGDGVCESIESVVNCAVDCTPSICGDGFCDSGEDQCNCAIDCGDPPATETNCTDGMDNDCDGLTDCNDPDCAADPACAAPFCGDGFCGVGEDQCNCATDCGAPLATETNCADGVDNDCDGLADCADPDCNADPACQPCLPDDSPCNSDAECCGGRCRLRDVDGIDMMICD